MKNKGNKGKRLQMHGSILLLSRTTPLKGRMQAGSFLWWGQMGHNVNDLHPSTEQKACVAFFFFSSFHFRFRARLDAASRIHFCISTKPLTFTSWVIPMPLQHFVLEALSLTLRCRWRCAPFLLLTNHEARGCFYKWKTGPDKGARQRCAHGQTVFVARVMSSWTIAQHLAYKALNWHLAKHSRILQMHRFLKMVEMCSYLNVFPHTEGQRSHQYGNRGTSHFHCFFLSLFF